LILELAETKVNSRTVVVFKKLLTDLMDKCSTLSNQFIKFGLGAKALFSSVNDMVKKITDVRENGLMIYEYAISNVIDDISKKRFTNYPMLVDEVETADKINNIIICVLQGITYQEALYVSNVAAKKEINLIFGGNEILKTSTYLVNLNKN